MKKRDEYDTTQDTQDKSDRRSFINFLLVVFVSVTLLSLFFAFSHETKVIIGCPQKCSCWEFKDDNVMVDCENANLMTIPKNVPPNTVFVDLAWNDIGIISNVAFNHWPSTVKYLDISYNDIVKVETRAFGKLNGLLSLDLHTNKITHLNNVSMPYSLRKLVLGNNLLEDSSAESIVNAPNLEILDITNCGLLHLQDRLQNLHSLKTISYTKYDENDVVHFSHPVHVITIPPNEKPSKKQENITAPTNSRGSWYVHPPPRKVHHQSSEGMKLREDL